MSRVPAPARRLRGLIAGAALTLATACSGGGEVPTLAPAPAETPAPGEASPATGPDDLAIYRPSIQDGRIVVPAPVPAPRLPSELPPLPPQ